MKRISSLALSTVVALLITGCGESSNSSSPTSKETAKPQAVTSQPAESVASSTDSNTGQVVADVAKQAEETVAEVQQQAKAIYEDLSTRLMTNTKTEANDLMKKISTDLESRVQKFSEAIPNSDELMGKLGTGVQSLLENKDINAVETFNELVASKLTPEQTSLAKDVYNAGAAFVTERNFSSLEGLNSDVAKLSTAVWKGDYTNAMQPLQNIWNKGSLSNEQKNLLGTVFDDYLPGWRENADTINKGVDALKKFGL